MSTFVLGIWCMDAHLTACYLKQMCAHEAQVGPEVVLSFCGFPFVSFWGGQIGRSWISSVRPRLPGAFQQCNSACLLRHERSAGRPRGAEA